MQQIKYTLGCVLLTILLASAVTVKADSVPDDVEFAVLKKFYDSLGGSAWTKKTNWPAAGSWPATATSAQFGTWYGVTVVNGDIAQIALVNNKLAGKLPSSIGDLKALKVLALNTNATLSGSIPTSLGTIPVLEQILLYQCALSGTIPVTIVNATGLTVLNLTSNKLTGSIPANIGNLTKLTQLWLSNNQLGNNLPASLGNLVNLTSLQLYTNGFTGNIPATLGNLKKLTTLRLDDNLLTGSIPAVLGNLTALTVLYLQDNQLMGSIPPSLGYLVNLNSLYLQINQLTGSIPSSLGNLTRLQNLYLNNNALDGSLPEELANLTTLETLNVSANKLTGAIPAVYSRLGNLQNFYVQGNKFSGSLPASFSALTKLRYFYVNDNALTGGIPDSYTSLTEMVAFYLYNNQFSGSIYTGLLAGWTKLNYFYIYNNKFSGDFPSSIGNCPVLIGINASGNRFSTLPVGLLNLAVLATADFSNNEIKSAPAFASHVNKANLTLKLNNNLLDFSALESIAGGGIKALTISPQNAIHDIVSTKGIMNAPLTITARDPGAHGTITWEKQQADGSWADAASQNQDATARTFTRNTFALADEGVYRWKATNSVVTALTVQSDPITVKQTTRFVLDNWAYQYQYDGQRRVTGKKLPGADWVYMVYDERGRVVMTQDGEQRKANQWSYVTYDAYNRPIITGIYTHSGFLSQADMSALISTTVFYETYTGNSANHGYSNTVFASSGFVATGFNPQTVTYYDNYGFKPGWGMEYNYLPAQIDGQEPNMFTGVLGQVTGTKVKTLEDQPTWLYAVNYYDDKYRLIQRTSDNLKGGIDRVTSVYDFTGKVLASKSSHGTGMLTWQNMVAAKVDGDNLVRTKAGTSWGASGASSVEQIPLNADGWAEVSVSDIVNRRFFGLSNQDANQNFTSIKYAFYLALGGLNVYVNGNSVYTVPAGLATGDRLRIARESGYINFYQNGVKVYPTATASPLPSTESLLVDVAIATVPGAVRYSRISAGQSQSNTITRQFEYDHAGRLLKTWHQVNNGTKVLLAQNEYNELGQLVNRNIHSTEAAATADAQRHYKQSVDYRYNIRGWLTSINNSTLSNTSDVNPDPAGTPKDLFGMELAYNEPTGTTNTSLYNGNISAMKWSNSLGLGDVKENAYNYSYDPLNRIKEADFLQKKSGWSLPEYTDDNGNTQNAAAYSELGYDYDLNGNIKALTRKTAKGETMDALTYFYGSDQARSNKLLSVTDGGNKTTGFIDGNIIGDDFTYDANGSMIGDMNKDVASITYNYLHLPSKVTKKAGDYLVYTYDATGRKLRQQVYNASAVEQKQSDYAGEYFYENDTLKFINHEEGRIVTTTAADPEYQYFLKDHLGNVRLTFTTKVDTESTVATMETANAVTENGQYLNYDEAVTLDSKLFDHTSADQPIQPGRAYYSVLLRGEGQTGMVHEKYGLARSLSVMPGDTVKMEVFAKYINVSETNVAATVADALTNIGNGPTTNGPLIDGGVSGSLGATAFPFIGLLNHSDEPSGDAPKAYLNWLIFDRDFNFKDGGSHRVTTAAAETGTGASQHEHLADSIVIQEPGYVYIYLSNESETSVDVFFDDFGVEHVKGPVVQMEDYYPFGLTFNSHLRESRLPNRWKFQSQEHVSDLGLNWDSFKWRNHQPDIGRFFGVDPLTEKFYYNSPYAFSENKVTGHVELEGLEGFEATTAVYMIEFVVEAKQNSAVAGNALNRVASGGAGKIPDQVSFGEDHKMVEVGSSLSNAGIAKDAVKKTAVAGVRLGAKIGAETGDAMETAGYIFAQPELVIAGGRIADASTAVDIALSYSQDEDVTGDIMFEVGKKLVFGNMGREAEKAADVGHLNKGAEGIFQNIVNSWDKFSDQVKRLIDENKEKQKTD